MIKLTQLLLEEPMDDKTAESIVSDGIRVSIMYQDPELKKTMWYTVIPLKKDVINGQDVIVAKPVSASAKAKPKAFIQSRIVVWNRMYAGSYDKIQDAIVNKRVISFDYKGESPAKKGTREVVKPVCFGTTKGVYYLRAWQDSGDTETKVPAWKFFRFDRMSNMKVVGTQTFTTAPDVNFNPNGDAHIDKVIAIADFNPDEPPPPPSAPVIKPTPDKPDEKEEKPKPEKKPSTTTSTPTPPKEEPAKAKPKKQQYASTRTKKGGDDLKEAAMIQAIRDAVRIF